MGLLFSSGKFNALERLNGPIFYFSSFFAFTPIFDYLSKRTHSAIFVCLSHTKSKKTSGAKLIVNKNLMSFPIGRYFCT